MRRAKSSRKAGAIVKAAELAIAAPQVVALRTARMLAAGANPGAADRAELTQMSTEKVQAFWESMFAMGTQIVRTQQEYATTAALQWWRLWTNPSWLVPTSRKRQSEMSKLVDAALTPVHKRATANARRLGRIKKR